MKNFDRIPKPPKDRRVSKVPKKPDVKQMILDCSNWIKYCAGTLHEKKTEDSNER